MANQTKPNFAPMPGADTLLRAAPKLFLLSDGALDNNKMSGEASGIGNLDSYRDVIFPNAFKQAVLDDFLINGFIADGHDWTKMIGMPMVAQVRGNRLYTECEFHSTPDAQAVKTKCKERLDNGKTVGLSIGFGMYPASFKDFSSGAALLDYAQKNGYDLTQFDVNTIKACTATCRGIFNIDKLYEYSPVTVPANPAAWATEIKAALERSAESGNGMVLNGLQLEAGENGTLIVAKSNFLGSYVEAQMTIAALYRLTDALFSYGFYEAVYYSEVPKAERREQLAGCLMEFNVFALKVFDALISDDTTEEEVETALAAIKTLWPTPGTVAEGDAGETNPNELSLRAGERFAQTLDTARAAVQEATERAQSLVTLRKQDNRTLSGATVEKLTAQRDGLSGLLDIVTTLLEAPTKVSDTETAPAPNLASDVANVDLPALRSKSRLHQNFLREIELEEETESL